MNHEEIFKITPGSIVPGNTRSYAVNAIASVELNLRQKDGTSIPGRSVSVNDELTVIDVSESRQLALVQYPSGNDIRQGYVTNNAKYISYLNPSNWHNGTTKEEVINYDGSNLGWLSPFETATKLYVVNGLTQVVYNTKLGINTKSGFVRYAGGSQNVVNINIPYPNVTNAEVIQYGTSGKGRALKAYKMGNGRNSFIYNCAIHGWEDHWAGDGVELTKIGNKLIEHFQNNSIGDFTLYVIPVANPDGVSEGWTNNGSGRCTVVGGVDCNRDFPVGFTPGGEPRYYTGANPLSVPESRELANFIQGIKNRTTGETYLIDMHGWETSLVGSAKIGEHFVHKLGLEAKYRFGSRGFLIEWANSIGIISALLELPRSTQSPADVINGRYAEKIIEGLSEIICVKKSGWKEENGKWYYYDQDGNMKKGWQKLPRYADGTGDLVWFYFESDGVMQTGWKHIGPSWYYLNEKGIMQTGWQKLPRYMNGTGDLVWFYFNAEGMMQIGWKNISNNWYYLDQNGIMQTGWHELPKNADGSGKIEWFYFYQDGIMATNTTIDGWVIGADGVATKPGDSNGGNDGDNGNTDYDNNSEYHRVLRVKDPFMKGEDVKKVQSKLNSLNYNVGSVDGVYGYVTEEQVIRYQRAKGLSPDGAVGEITWNSLMNADSSGGGSGNEEYDNNPEYHRVLRVKNPLMRGEDVKKVQSKLNSLNYNVGSVDGAYGYGTEEQVIKFQKAKGLTADGAVGQDTWNKLMNESFEDNIISESEFIGKYKGLGKYFGFLGMFEIFEDSILLTCLNPMGTIKIDREYQLGTHFPATNSEILQVYANGNLMLTNTGSSGLELEYDRATKKLIPAFKLFDGNVYLKLKGPTSISVEFYRIYKANNGSKQVGCASFTITFYPMSSGNVPTTTFDKVTSENLQIIFNAIKKGIQVSVAIGIAAYVIASFAAIPVTGGTSAAIATTVIGSVPPVASIVASIFK